MREPRVFTIPSGVPFLPTLADSLLSGELIGGWPDGVTLADTTVYLPTRRAGRALNAILAARGGGRATLLPRIVPLGDAETGAEPDGFDDPGRPPAIPPLERRLILTRLVQAWAAHHDRREELQLAPDVPFLVPGTPADAVGLAADLETLMDALATDDVAWDALADVVESEYSTYYAFTLRFLRIAHESWPAILSERGASDPARRRHEALAAGAARLLAGEVRGPVVAAGSTGSVPATARLLAAIARAPHGALVLPGLDTDLDPVAWDAIAGGEEGGARHGPLYGHPQFMLRRLLDSTIGIGREAVRVLGGVAPQPEAAAARRRLLSEAMRPAETTDRWAAMPTLDRTALALAGSADLALVEAADEREEALAIAIALRETLAEPGRTAALVTTDRGLARRVAAELRRWNVTIEDSAGTALADTTAGRLARLAAEAAPDFEPAAVLALTAHPLVTLGLPRAAIERARSALEIAVLRGPAPRPGLDGIAAALAFRHRERGFRDPPARKRLRDKDWSAAARLLRRLQTAFEPLADLSAEDEFDLVAVAERHADVMAALTRSPRGSTEPPDESLEALKELFDELARASATDGAHVTGRLRDYPAFFAAFARDRSMSPGPGATHRRVKILGLLEARLLGVDRVVLGGLDESIWPPAAESDAFLNRPMRLELGLTPPERRIGQSAHDFVQALGANDAILTRARKRDMKPTVPSRFLERLRAFAGEAAWTSMSSRGQTYLGFAAALDEPAPALLLQRPAPRPGGGRFPLRLSVTEIETLVRDPYVIYARHILKLSALEPLATEPSMGERGSLIHDVLAQFSEIHPGSLPRQADEILLQLGLDAFGELERTYPELHALWWPEFERLVPHYLAWETARRGEVAALHVERSGELSIPLSDHVALRLRGRADRIEFHHDGGATIVDYKTGTPPTDKVIAVGFSPQMTLEAAILMSGGFAGLPAPAGLPQLDYVKLGSRALLVTRTVKPPKGDNRDMAAIVDEHVGGLAELARRYVFADAGYLSRPHAQYALRFSDYDHLARVKEWSLAGAPEAEA